MVDTEMLQQRLHLWVAEECLKTCYTYNTVHIYDNYHCRHCQFISGNEPDGTKQQLNGHENERKNTHACIYYRMNATCHYH